MTQDLQRLLGPDPGNAGVSSDKQGLVFEVEGACHKREGEHPKAGVVTNNSLVVAKAFRGDGILRTGQLLLALCTFVSCCQQIRDEITAALKLIFNLCPGQINPLAGICSHTLRRWGLDITDQGVSFGEGFAYSVDRRKGARREVAHRLTIKERLRVIDSVNDPRFADLTPIQIVAIFAEEIMNVGSESTIYRLLRQEGLLNHRGSARSSPLAKASPGAGGNRNLPSDGLGYHLRPGSVKGQFFYLYMVMDVWSRRILGVEVHERECSELASEFFDRVCRDEGISKETAVVLHSHNGAPMRSFTLAAKMAELGMSLSFSRPRVSNDNAYAESWFRTMKYHQSYPLRRFRDLLSVKARWMALSTGTTLSTGTAASST